MTIGILGGSFDPIHTGHAILANYIAQSGLVDEVWLMVSRRNPLKDKTYAGEQDRLEMARITANTCENIKVSDFEFNLPVPSFTYTTLQSLKLKYPENSFKIIIGSDSFLTFHQWRNSGNILKEFGVIVYPRPGYPLEEEAAEGFSYIRDVPVSGLSSTFIRQCIKRGWNIEYFVPDKVREYIIKNKLYR